MTVPVFPVSAITNVVRELRAAVSYTESPYSFQGQAFDWGGRQWSCEIEVATRPGPSAKALSAFLAALAGPATVFTVVDPTINNAGAGTVTVSGAAQTGNDLVTTGWSTAPEVGDFISIGTGAAARLYQITATTGTLPAQTLTLAPALRSSPADGAAVEIASPVVALRMRDPVPVGISADGSYRASFRAVEAL
ncbi:hypothetical protein P6F26_16855 [Roseibacterium sp. SDUM158017]|uniref:hypothetical protein n=1 Tax=Roseicyclus salinarum TaxID=3036773 RepID=UPI0024156B4A|nr:hypothetical protein [Roseibacterium sp. SDUM158017]MDG4650120.1 hypothetical protein [Roseibacterium sp. SDUM158017]